MAPYKYEAISALLAKVLDIVMGKIVGPEGLINDHKLLVKPIKKSIDRLVHLGSTHCCAYT